MTRTLADGRRDTKLGTTPSGKVIWLEKHPSEYKGWSPSDHLYAAVIHGANRTRGGAIETAHRALAGGARTKDLEWRDSPRRGAGVLTAQGRGGRGSGYYEIELHQGHTVRYHSPDGSQVLTGPHAGGLKFAKEIANDHNRSARRGK